MDRAERPPALAARTLRALRPLGVLRGWERLISAAAPMASGRAQTFEAPFFTSRYRGDLGNVIDRDVYFHGAYERDELLLAARLLADRPAGAVLDVGANTGHHSLFFSEIAPAVHAFEPNAALHRTLEDRMRLANRRNVTLHPFGLWDEDAELEFFLPDAHNLGMGTFVEGETDPATQAGRTRLPVRPGDAVLKGLGPMSVSLIKMDVQGAEARVLRGLRETIAAHRPVMWVEISESTRGEIPSLEALKALCPVGPCQALGLQRRSPLTTRRSARAIDAGGYEAFVGNLFIVPSMRA